MDEDLKYTLDDLQRCSYRFLQQLAKSMSLPSNVKKVYLIQLIMAKKYHSEVEVQNIVLRVRRERQQLAVTNQKQKQRKRVRLQGTEVTSTINTPHSPPIGSTPKRAGVILRCSSDIQAIAEYNSKQSLFLTDTQSKIPSTRNRGSDRVLRSFNLKSYKKPNYSIMNSVIGVINTQGRVKRQNETQISVYTHREASPKLSIARCLLKKKRPSILNNSAMMRGKMPVPARHHFNSELPMPVKRHRSLSGIYPINPPQASKSFDCIQSIGFRRTDGKISKINALVQKSTQNKYQNYPEPQRDRNVEVTIQDIINSNIDAQTFTNPIVSEYMLTDSSIHYPNMSSLTDIIPNSYTTSQSESDALSVYYHKKIRAEQVRCQRQINVNRDVPRNVANEYRLPKINDVFSKFSEVRSDVTQPLYVHVSEVPERLHNPYFGGTVTLEGLYNFRSQHLPAPLLRVATTADTRCVFSTPLIATAVQQTATVASNQPYQVSSCERDSQYPCTSDEVSRMYDFLRLAEQEITLRKYHEALCSSTSSVESQDLEASVTIPEMVEDALEIISQDGDYMERIGMDVRMQCVLCSWAGPKFVLDYHIRKEHSDEILKQDRSEWNITYKLGSLVNQDQWLSQVTQFESTLYILSVRYEDPDCFMAALSTISSESEPKVGSITIYNKVTGEPNTWQGHLQSISTNMPYENDSSCLKLELSGLDLLPNSANLKLLNRELVIKSPTKVVVGHPELNDIHIIMFIKIW